MYAIRSYYDPLVFLPFPTQTADGGFIPQKGLGGESTKGDDDPWTNGGKLTFEERFAGGNLLGEGVAIPRRSTFSYNFV